MDILGSQGELSQDERERAITSIKAEMTAALLGDAGQLDSASYPPQLAHLREGFLRARQIRAFLARDSRWRLNNWMSNLSGRGREDQHAEVVNCILQLVILSRIVVDSPDQTLGQDRVFEERRRLQAELGIDDVANYYLPGITADEVIGAIVDGRVYIGNPEQPNPYGRTVGN